MNLRFWLRWSWRDLRARWLQVVAIALIIALGTGVFAGLGGQKTWRIDSYDASYGRLNMFDLRVQLTEGSYVAGDALIDQIEAIDGVATVETRLLTPTLVDASTDSEDILVKGLVIGVDVADGGPHVNGVYVDEGDGRTLTVADAESEQNVAVVEYKFARHYELEPGSPLRISGNHDLVFVGSGHSPEYFMVMPETGQFFAESTFVALFVPLETAQRLAGREGLVNDVVLLLDNGADSEVVQAELENRLDAAFPETGYSIMTTGDDPVYSTLYSDAEGDQQLWNTVAMLFLIGAAMGAFNLAGRMVESQRRQIGIGMALGVPRKWLAFRPMLVGVQIAVLGTLFGLVTGFAIGKAFLGILEANFPLPYYVTSFYLPGFLIATLLGISIPFLATLIPVWRAVRVAPLDAIQTGYIVAKGGGLNKLANRLPIPGRSFSQMPVRNILRSPWRTTLTVLGIAIAIMLLTFIVGALDSFVATMDQADDAFRHQGRNRVLVNLDFFYPVDNGEVTAISTLTSEDNQPLVAGAETALLLGGTLIKDGVEIETALELHDMESAIWRPALVAGSLQAPEGEMGVIISEKAAKDLEVEVGDTITLEHPVRSTTSLFAFRFENNDVTIIGIHDNPLRPLSYMLLESAAMMGLADVTNQIVLEPAPDASADDIKTALLTQAGVTSVEPISEFSEGVERMLELAAGMLRVIQGVVLVMAFLIAFNTTSISVDERVREIATMFAFGLPVRTVTRMQIVENVIIGVLGTLLGILAGWVVVNLVFTMDTPELEEFNFIITLAPATLVAAAVLGVLVVALTPLLSVRKMTRMDIPSTLRVME